MTYEHEIADAKENINLIKKYGVGDRLLDCGANIGEVSIQCAPLFKEVTAVEAHPTTAAKAHLRIMESGLKNIQLINAAVMADDADLVYVSTPGKTTGATARLKQRLKEPPAGYYQTAEAIAFNTLLLNYRPTTVKMDIEGCEYDVLESAQFPIDVGTLIVEFHGTRSAKNWKRFNHIVGLLGDQGFRRIKPLSLSMVAGAAHPRTFLFTGIFQR